MYFKEIANWRDTEILTGANDPKLPKSLSHYKIELDIIEKHNSSRFNS